MEFRCIKDLVSVELTFPELLAILAKTPLTAKRYCKVGVIATDTAALAISSHQVCTTSRYKTLRNCTLESQKNIRPYLTYSDVLLHRLKNSRQLSAVSKLTTRSGANLQLQGCTQHAGHRNPTKGNSFHKFGANWAECPSK